MAVTRRPDVILTDLSMPFVDGWTLLRTLKQHPVTAQIPVVVLTGHDDIQHRQRAQDAGSIAFLATPCDPALLARTLREALRRAVL